MELIYKDLISDELKELEISLLESISSDVNLATEISNYLLVSGGKRIRPSICILLAKVFNYEGNDLIKLAASIELLHTATLIHDDVVDESLIRRGKESIHSKWDNAHGVLVGDFVYSKAFQLMASFEDQKIIRELANSTNRISEGEVLQLSFKQEVLEEKDYLEKLDKCTNNLNTLVNAYNEYEFLPQTMPPFPWHQGGRSFHNILTSKAKVLDFLQRTDCNICFVIYAA